MEYANHVLHLELNAELDFNLAEIAAVELMAADFCAYAAVKF